MQCPVSICREATHKWLVANSSIISSFGVTNIGVEMSSQHENSDIKEVSGQNISSFCFLISLPQNNGMINFAQK